MNYTVKAASRATGVSESRLRTWERRYGIPSPHRAPTGRRLYDDDDLAVIRRMAALVDAGMSAHEAADAARTGAAPENLAAEQPREHPMVAQIAEASEHFDEARLLAALREAVAELGWADTLDQVVFPGLKRVGTYWESAVFPPANEHFASELISFELAAAYRDLPLPDASQPGIVMACPQDERHTIGIQGLAMLLKSRGIRVIYLGGDVPTQDFVTAHQASGAQAVCIAATTAIGLASLVRASRALVSSHHIRLFIGGPATSASGLEAAGIRLPPTMSGAVDTVLHGLKVEPKRAG